MGRGSLFKELWQTTVTLSCVCVCVYRPIHIYIYIYVYIYVYIYIYILPLITQHLRGCLLLLNMRCPSKLGVD